MRRWWYTAMATFVCAMIATVCVGPSQATALGAPGRGFVAEAITLGSFLGPLVLVVALVTAGITTALRLVVSSAGSRAVEMPAVRFLLGLLPVGVLVAVPANDFGDILGLAGAWLVSGGVGGLAVGTSEEGRATISWRVVLLGGAVAVCAGFAMVFVQSSINAP
ncbi:hypothetical protein [Salinarimonas chemoclinalis]|uniref:hypothetical protein n=1 Tax=Salinarimonas chemoclinalis TaxID=3241599 RepID=UPI003556D066